MAGRPAPLSEDLYCKRTGLWNLALGKKFWLKRFANYRRLRQNKFLRWRSGLLR